MKKAAILIIIKVDYKLTHKLVQEFISAVADISFFHFCVQ